MFCAAIIYDELGGPARVKMYSKNEFKRVSEDLRWIICLDLPEIRPIYVLNCHRSIYRQRSGGEIMG